MSRAQAMLWTALVSVSALIEAPMAPSWAQNVVTFENWQGFANRSPDGEFERCVLFNRSIEALTASPDNMLGITRDTQGHIGLMVFYQPRALTRGSNVPLRLKVGDRAPVTIQGQVVSDFHLVTTTPLDSATMTALRTAKSIETTVEDKTQKFEVDNIGGVLDELAGCIDRNMPK